MGGYVIMWHKTIREKMLGTTFLINAALVFSILGSTPQAFANEAEAGGDELKLDEIVVTGVRKRDEKVIDVPAAMDIFSGKKIRALGITKPEDFVALTSNVTMVKTQNAGTTFLVVRGISQARNSEPSVAVIIDGVQQINANQFDQDLFDISKIEVLKGPQGALYGRNAIGGAVVITTKGPTEEFEYTLRSTVDNGGPGLRFGGGVSGPITDNLGFTASLEFMDVNGYNDNVFLKEKVDPAQSTSGRIRFVWEPSDDLTLELRGSMQDLVSRALHFVITDDVNDTATPIQVNNRGKDSKKTYSVSAKADYSTEYGSFSSVISWDKLTSFDTGDAFNFLPIEKSFFFNFGPAFGLPKADQTQGQFHEVEAVSQEIRFVSPSEDRLRYIVGAYGVLTRNFLSTYAETDVGSGFILPRKRFPFDGSDGSIQTAYLGDQQNNKAWAVFGDIAYDVMDNLEVDLSLRYDKDIRRNTTKTPLAFLPVGGTPGEVRNISFDAWQPKATIRYSATENLSVYGGYSRGFRSGGFNAAGVAAVAQASGIIGVKDTYGAEIADTYEVGFKSELLDGDLKLNGAVYYTESKNSYFFVFLAANQTQNLANIDLVTYQGFEVDATWHVTENLTFNGSYGYTDSEIKKFEDPTTIGNQAPLVTKSTINFGGEYRQPVSDEIDFFARVQYQRIGDTYWENNNVTVRNPVDLVDARLSFESEGWTVTLWSKNLFNKKYNSEYLVGGFTWKALPRTWGLTATMNFGG